MASERPSFPGIYMTLARALAARSTCEIEPVGAVITSVDFRKVLAIGYRNNAAGLPNRCDREPDGSSCGCLHAEENAVIHCDAPRSEPKIVFATRIPCRMCAKRLINLGGVQDLYVPTEEIGKGATREATREASRKASRKASREGGREEATIDLLGSVGIRVHSLD